MNYSKYRTYPRVYKKKAEEEKDDHSLTLSGAAAAGIIVLTFIKGMFWGYILNKQRLHKKGLL